ncbi:MAG: protein-L-isoaspartate(D-aspartate) O-methyltransferase [Deltaproteobacteria bacterium]|nr:protein-L-isoaspartate(D-aspartate) O-methyltransferase [Deltaproteobacteria bacterium]MBW2051946.1 protein-L-isoaspartate(D-aspartate) O-methyltransferase [Deltaproteobacteria bacterium]MBW2139901.1 protein-L-isoaspartate(D-aspartate) O-methyltransferase [Deltaproteobacteria bacterium]MBW2323080.1 protein-L-isoaspartate(D-aspartate) O-methyltransferase [Deltaproteobacteria bacterium]
MNKNDYHLSRRQMVVQQLETRGIKDQKLLEVMNRVGRHLFVEEALQSQGYADNPLPIGENQTISQPYIVALMTEALELTGKEKVLEIGTGSGYQTAILAELCYKVCTIERIRFLLTKARKLLDELQYYNILFRLADGSFGWKEEAPFEAIIVTAGAPAIPQPLIKQLAPLGRMVIPVGESRGSQTLVKLVKKKDNSISRFDLGGCRFVDLIGGHGWSSDNNKSSRW